MKKIICFILLLTVVNQIYTSAPKRRRVESSDFRMIATIGRSCHFLVATENSQGDIVNEKRLEHKNLIMENVKKALLSHIPPSGICRYLNIASTNIKYLKYILATEHFAPLPTYNESYSIKGLESNIDVLREWKRNKKPEEGKEQAKICIANIIKQERILKHNGSKAFTSLQREKKECLKSVIDAHINVFKIK